MDDTACADSFAWMIRTLATCRSEADKLHLEDLSRLLNMAIYQTALEWEDAEPNDRNDHLEQLLRLKLKLAYSEPDSNVVVLNSKTAGEV
ncbi:hypothetical protein [Pseudohoeflea coraliihabitans]|uniref:Uncharacterized protein n=1 Tax=Pseudohoeflea coraliihabitans TaxID=2860393 RepID=A0ABS6WS76_9HYPH|nr:hypothetical protein [Pseudohoeflea sp. DP4N28-3]MBW3098785.1 hypothetical protein [Pseudohoeflea sp. DP4N28-3]